MVYNISCNATDGYTLYGVPYFCENYILYFKQPRWTYDNKNYHELDEITQREKLIQDILKYGIEILDEENVDRFKLIGKTLSIKEIVDKMNDVILNLKW